MRKDGVYTPNDDPWIIYGAYTNRFTLRSFEELNITDDTGTAAYNARSYGVLNSAYVGFDSPKSNLYVLDGGDDGVFVEVDEDYPIYVKSGQYSGPYHIFTSDSVTYASL